MLRAAALAAILSTMACGFGAPAAAAPHATPPVEVSLGTVRVGALFPTTGPDAAAGVDALDGVQLAADVLNGAHPEIALPRLTVGTIALDAADTAGDPRQASDAVDRLVGADRVVALTGALQSDVTAAASERAERLTIPMVSGSATALDLTGRSLRWFWRVGPSDATYVETYFAWLHAVHQAKPAQRPIGQAVVVHSADQASRDGAALLERLAPPDVKVAEDVQLPNDGSDLTPEVQRLDGYAPDVLFVQATLDDATRLVRTMARVGYTPPALLGLSDGLADPSFASGLGPMGDFVVARTAWAPEIGLRKPVAAAVTAAFRQEFGRDMTADSARDFEAMLTLGDAIRAADSTDPTRIRAALARTNLAETIMAWPGIRFDAAGQNTMATGVLEQVSMGQYHVIYPAEVAAANLVWPMPALDRR